MKIENSNVTASPAAPASPAEKTIPCKQCGGTMHSIQKRNTGIGAQLGVVALAVVGMILLFVFPFGTTFGLALLIGAAVINFRKEKRWKCDGCGYSFKVE
jgi:hypothetical protein